MAIKITEQIENGERLHDRIIPLISEIPCRRDSNAECSPQAISRLSAITQDLTEWLNVSLDIIKRTRPEYLEDCEKKRKSIIDSVDAEKYVLLFFTDSVCATVSGNLRYIIGVLKSIKESNAIIRPSGDKIFIVHGHDKKLLEDVRRFVMLRTDNEPIVLSDEAQGSQTIYEKFLDKSATCSHAIVLMTADDECISGSNEGSEKRARQNVIFEYGYFIGSLGKSNVFLIYDKSVKLPSDLNGIAYANSEEWESDLKKELDAWDSNSLI